MQAKIRPLLWSTVVLLALTPFQNCGGKLASSHAGAASSQCKAILKAEALQGVNPSVFNCGDFNNYLCERRIFSPDVETMSHALKECVGSGDVCVDVDVRMFSTASAKSAGEDASLFEAGGSYNREEDTCRHKFVYQGVAIFDGSADNLEQALALAMKACENAGGPL